ncbi:MAG: hypothetical protein KC561_13235, partial [Myxococcales bacterium]|nr:hypothetical protein [Myxococcales bacterium]
VVFRGTRDSSRRGDSESAGERTAERNCADVLSLARMTGPYEWNPMPHVLDVACPTCRSAALFEFAEVVRIHRRDDIPFFEESSLFEHQMFDGGAQGRWHGAVYYSLLHGPAETTIDNLPAGYAPSDWNHSTFLYRSHGTDEGAVACGGCGRRARHHLDWPSDALFQIAYRGQVLWAFHRESAQELRDYVASANRNRQGYRWELFLRHVPTVFLTAKARETVVKRLDRIL